MMHTNRSGLLKLAVTAGILFWVTIAVTPAKADIVTVKFQGIVGTIGSNLLGAGSPLGTEGDALDGLHTIHFMGFYTFNTAIGSSVTSASTNLSVYSDKVTHFEYSLQRDAVPAQSITAINYSYSNVPGAIGPQNTIAVGNGAATPGAVEILGGVPESRPLDSYQVGVSLSGDPINGIFNPSDFEFNYIHNNSTSTSLHPQGGPFNDSSLLANTSILSTPSDVSSPPGLNWLQDSHANGSFRIIFTGGGASVVNGTMLSMSLVATPLPPAVILFGAGLVALIGLGARNWRQRETA